MMESSAVVYCLQRDRLLVEEILPACVREFEQASTDSLGVKLPISLRVCEKDFLLERTLTDLTTLDLSAIKEEHEIQNVVPQYEDDRLWFCN